MSETNHLKKYKLLKTDIGWYTLAVLNQILLKLYRFILFDHRPNLQEIREKSGPFNLKMTLHMFVIFHRDPFEGMLLWLKLPIVPYSNISG